MPTPQLQRLATDLIHRVHDDQDPPGPATVDVGRAIAYGLELGLSGDPAQSLRRRCGRTGLKRRTTGWPWGVAREGRHRHHPPPLPLQITASPRRSPP